MSLRIGIGLNIRPTSTPTPPIDPALLLIGDGNSVGWYDYLTLSSITKDGSNNISAWADRLGGANTLGVAGTPHYDTDGVTLDGINECFTKAFALIQPVTMYIACKMITWADNMVIVDGITANSGKVNVYSAASFNAIAYGGSSYSSTRNWASGTWSIIRVHFNGANSSFRIGTIQAADTGSWGTGNMAGLTFGKLGSNNLFFANIRYKGMLVRKVNDSVADDLMIYNYLKTYYGI